MACWWMPWTYGGFDATGSTREPDEPLPMSDRVALERTLHTAIPRASSSCATQLRKAEVATRSGASCRTVAGAITLPATLIG